MADLSREPAPPAASFVANVPPAVHAGIAASWRDVAEPRVGLLSGFGPGDADDVAAGYAACGFSERRPPPAPRMGGLRGVAGTVTDAVVISRADHGARWRGDGHDAACCRCRSSSELTIADPGDRRELVIHNATGAPLRVAVEDVGDIAIPATAARRSPLRAEPGGLRIHLQALSAGSPSVVMVIVSVEPSDDGPIAVGQAIGASHVLTRELVLARRRSAAGSISSSKDIEPGVRAMLLLADGPVPARHHRSWATRSRRSCAISRAGSSSVAGEVGQPRVATTTLGLAAALRARSRGPAVRGGRRRMLGW